MSKFKALFILFVLILPLSLSVIACDDNNDGGWDEAAPTAEPGSNDESNDVPDTGTEEFDDIAEEVGDGMEDAGGVLGVLQDVNCSGGGMSSSTTCDADGDGVMNGNDADWEDPSVQ